MGYLRQIKRLISHLRTSPDAPERIYIRRGDEARGRRDWASAAASYRAALDVKPDMFHIWVQLGHALKEQEAWEAALEAYGRASELRPDLSEAFIFMAHLAKRMGRTETAVRCFIKALGAGEQSYNEADELLFLLAQLGDADRNALIDLLRDALSDMPPRPGEAQLLDELRRIVTLEIAPAERPAPPPAGTGSALVFDISDLISYFTRARLPTGIQRVQIETIEGALQRDEGREIRLCCFIDGRDEWLELPLDRMREIAKLSTSGGDRFDPAWIQAIASLRLFLSLTLPFDFPQGASLINLGTSWWLQNYFLFVRHAKATKGIRYIPFVHDMIPIMTPEHCTRGLTQDFISWVIGVFDHADHFLVNSQATKRDLVAVSQQLGRPLDPANVAVIPLDTDFRKDGGDALPARSLDAWGLRPDGFVLFVSTIESRKGHLIAFDAWADLIARHGADAVPQLVCVGNRGWLNDRIYQRIAEDPAVGAKVTMLSKLTDDELSLLYRSSLFTLYPSLYEGWGLPVTESLCYGKVPLISDAASLPEAGGDFAVYAKAGSTTALADAASRLIVDPDYRVGLETRISAEFRPRAWSDLAHQIADQIDRFAADAGGVVLPATPPARPGAWHSLARNDVTRIWSRMRTGEIYRSNLEWHWPDARGCRIRPDDAELRIPLDPHPPLRILFKLVGDEHGWSSWSLRCGDILLDGSLSQREEKWVWFDLPAADAAHELNIRFDAHPADEMVKITYFVSGFFVLPIDDSVSRTAFVEAVALGRLDMLDAFRDA